MEEKIYCGGAKIVETKYDDIISILVDLTAIKEEGTDFIFKSSNGNSCIRLKATKRKAPDKIGNTHSVIVDTWKPDPSKGRGKSADLQKDPDDLCPF